VVNYVDVELDQLEKAVSDSELKADAIVAAKRAAFEEQLNNDPEVVAARRAVEDCKSDVKTFHAIESQQSEEVDAGAVADGSESEDEAEEGEASVPGVEATKPARKLEVVEESDDEDDDDFDDEDDDLEEDEEDDDDVITDDLDKDY
jgi:hypothetical protein